MISPTLCESPTEIEDIELPSFGFPLTLLGMTGETQHRIVAVIREALDGEATLTEETCPSWLLRPGRAEIGTAWNSLNGAYAALTGLALPDAAPPRERRRLDVVLAWADGSSQVVEIDETQHFTPERLLTLDHYPSEAVLGYDVEQWRTESAVPRRPRGGGWGRPRPPLFPGEGGRHRQRAFRDMLADLLPPQYDWRPTIRLHAESVLPDLAQPDSINRVRVLLHPLDLFDRKTR